MIKHSLLQVFLWVSLFAAANAAIAFWYSRQTSESAGQSSSLETSTKKFGFVCKEYECSSGERQKYIVFIPRKSESGVKPPVILYLNGFGENGDDGIAQIAENFGLPAWEMKSVFPFLVVAPQCPRGGSWDPSWPFKKQAMSVLDRVIDDYGGDSERVVLTGPSSGGRGALQIAATDPSRFAAIVAVSARGEPPDCAKLSAMFTAGNVPAWIFYNDADSRGGVATLNRRLCQEAIRLGASPVVSGYPARGHNCWSRAYRTPALYSWMLEQSLSNNRLQNEKFRSLLPGPALNAWRATGGSKWTFDAEEHLEGIADSATNIGYLISDESFQTVEFHFGVRFEGSEACRIVIGAAGEGDAVEGWTVDLALAEHWSGGVTAPDGGWMASLDPLAQRSLMRDQWNDVRVRVLNDQFVLHLNGARAVDFRHESLRTLHGKLALQVPESGKTAWRWLRVRSLNAPAGEQPNGG